MEATFSQEIVEETPARSVFSPRQKWISSRFNTTTWDENGFLVLYNSFSGGVVTIPRPEADRVSDALAHGFLGHPSGILAGLCLGGFFVMEELDELGKARELHAGQFGVTDVLQLSLMPTEQCNFRCTYCAQSFVNGKMSRPVIDGVVGYVERRAQGLSALHVGWFGGEPLAGADVIEEISERFLAICARRGIRYSATITTNGFLLNSEVAAKMLRCGVRRFQVTLDGAPEHHDRLRVLADGKTGTFARIVSNLRALKARMEDCKVTIRVNFDPDSAGEIEPFIEMMKGDFGGDPRFTLDFQPVGKWGGPNDHRLKVCGVNEGDAWSAQLAQRASRSGFETAALRARLEPFGSRCYAADPKAFVVGSDGTLYKCTVALEDPRNRIGHVTAEGEFVIDSKKHAMWIANGEETDTGCQACSFRPSCQGNACPLARMDTNSSACPSVKRNLVQIVQIVAQGSWQKHQVSHAVGAR